ncbi:MAG: serine hydrolase [Gemmatimonadaceae bacterium]|nr:serine hydrolase [Gemmatimonadaceae bacterium]
MLRIILTAMTLTRADSLPARTPTSVGMSEVRLEAIERVVKRGISAGGFPGAAVIVGRKGSTVLDEGFGTLSWNDPQDPVDPHRTLYDIASLSKVVGTTTAMMILYDEKKVDLDTPVVRYLPTFGGGLKDNITIRQLLTHTSGLPAGRDLYRIAHSPIEARAALLATPLEYAPGQTYVYSDLGADVLALIVEVVAGETLDTFLQRRVFGPLGMGQTFYRPADSVKYRTAPTAIDPPRGYPIRGEVHDENAWALGGVAGHAGLFSTASDLAVFAQMMLNGGEYNGVQIVSKPTVDLFTKRAFGHRALGWDTADGDFGSGRYLGASAYGHTGFTGTSIWIDPDRQMFMILLTNRIHAAKAKRPAKVISDIRADLSDAAVLAVMDDDSGFGATPAKFRADREVGWNPEPPRRHVLHRSKHHRTATSHRTAKSSKKKASAGAKKHATKPKSSKTSRKHHSE